MPSIGSLKRYGSILMKLLSHTKQGTQLVSLKFMIGHSDPHIKALKRAHKETLDSCGAEHTITYPQVH